jgi:hypothetical protein
MADAPSDSGDALPAVTMPSALKAGLSLASASALASARGTLVRAELAPGGVDGHEVEREPLARALGELLRAQAPGVGVLAADAVEDRDLLGGLAQRDGPPCPRRAPSSAG